MHPDDTWPEDMQDDDGTIVPLRRHAQGQSQSANQRTDQRNYMTGEAAKPRPVISMHLGMDDILGMLLREFWLMAVVFGVIFGIGVMAAMSMTSTYTANASLLMQLGKDYVYDPLAGDAARGATATIDQVVQSEVEILNSTELKKRVIAKVGYRVVLPETPALWNPKTPVQRAEADAAALKVLQSGFSASTAPQNNVVRLSFKHVEAMSASLILNTLIDAYQTYRQQVFTDSIGPALERQKESFDDRLAVADTAYRDFLMQNGVGDFVTARTTYARIYDQVTGDLFTTQSQIAEDRAKLSEIKSNLASLSPEMSVERDLDLSVPNKIFALKQQRQELLARYLPTAQPVKDLEAQIAAYEALMRSGNGVGEQAHKLGTNPIFQDLTTQKLNMEAELASLEGKRAQLQSQADQVTQKLQALLGLEAQYNSLSTDRDSLQKIIGTFTQRIQENDAQREMTKGTDDAVRVVEKASLPDKPKSFKKIVLIMSFLFAAFTALCAGGLRIVTRRGFAGAGMAAKVLDLPVLATAGVKHDRGGSRAA